MMPDSPWLSFNDLTGIEVRTDIPDPGMGIQEFAEMMAPKFSQLIDDVAQRAHEETGEPYEICRAVARYAMIGQ